MAPQLQVLAGSTRADLKVVAVNKDQTDPLPISTSAFEGHVTIRIKDFAGPDGEASPQSGYFDKHSDMTYSILLAGRFLKPVPADDVVWGNVFEKPIRDQLPYGTTAALHAMHYIDPSLKHDVWADRPWAWSPLLATMNYINVEKLDPDGKAPGWSAERPQEDCSVLVEDHLADNGARQKYFGNEKHRQAVTLGPEHFITAEFANGLLNFNNLSVNLPVGGLSFSLAGLWKKNPQDVTYVLHNPADDSDFFVVVFRIVDPDLIAEAEKSSEETAAPGRTSQPANDEGSDDDVD